jgi:hypothetical protein
MAVLDFSNGDNRDCVCCFDFFCFLGFGANEENAPLIEARGISTLSAIVSRVLFQERHGTYKKLRQPSR